MPINSWVSLEGEDGEATMATREKSTEGGMAASYTGSGREWKARREWITRQKKKKKKKKEESNGVFDNKRNRKNSPSMFKSKGKKKGNKKNYPQ